MKLIKNEEKYYPFIYNLRTAPENLDGFVHQGEIPYASHLNYMSQHASSYWICLDESGEPVGFIGDVMEDIRLAVKPGKHGQGIGFFMLKEHLALSSKKENKAKVLLGNLSSNRLFQKAGFELYKSDEQFNYYKFEKL